MKVIDIRNALRLSVSYYEPDYIDDIYDGPYRRMGMYNKLIGGSLREVKIPTAPKPFEQWQKIDRCGHVHRWMVDISGNYIIPTAVAIEEDRCIRYYCLECDEPFHSQVNYQEKLSAIEIDIPAQGFPPEVGEEIAITGFGGNEDILMTVDSSKIEMTSFITTIRAISLGY
jgi:hypothetical protein